MREVEYLKRIKENTEYREKSHSNTPTAIERIDTENKESTEKDKQIFLHLTYHPKDLSRREIRQIYEKDMEKALVDHADITKMTICYHRDKHLRDNLVPSTLFQTEQLTVLKVLDEINAGL